MRKSGLLLLLVGIAFTGGFYVGRNYSQNPVLHTWRQQEIITVPGDVLCPMDHTCKWVAVDAFTNEPLKKLPTEKGDGR